MLPNITDNLLPRPCSLLLYGNCGGVSTSGNSTIMMLEVQYVVHNAGQKFDLTGLAPEWTADFGCTIVAKIPNRQLQLCTDGDRVITSVQPHISWRGNDSDSPEYDLESKWVRSLNAPKRETVLLVQYQACRGEFSNDLKMLEACRALKTLFG